MQNTEQTVEAVRTFDQRRRTIVICSCASAPVWELLRKLNAVYPDRINIELTDPDADVTFYLMRQN